MANFSDLSQKGQLGIVAVVLILLSGGVYWFSFRPVAEENHTNQLKLEAKKAENDKLRPYERNLPELNRTTEALRLQLENLQRIVPDEKEADQFMHAMQAEARRSNVEIRRYTSKPTVSREFYTEVPFDMELDGSYYSLLTFFDRVGKLERIINISDLKLYSLKGGEKAPVKQSYVYGANETVVAMCEARTFFSHDSLRVEEKPKDKSSKKAAK